MGPDDVVRNGDLDAELERLLDDDPIPDRVPGWADHSAPSPTYGTCQPSGFLALELYTGTTDTDAELDHVVAWADGGGTSEANLRAYCLHHHRLKHHAGWPVDAHPDGRLTWTTPTGHRHITENHD
ncbi:MAG: hypothetical protein QOK35_617, partial [Pseudonocardiales bacterium]|nr:hypothetical protein [Pseudonocardiales bacterium]